MRILATCPGQFFLVNPHSYHLLFKISNRARHLSFKRFPSRTLYGMLSLHRRQKILLICSLSGACLFHEPLVLKLRHQYALPCEKCLT